MKNLLFTIAFLFTVATSFAQSSVYVSGYTTSAGTYVAPHYRSAPNTTKNDNYSTVGNINPYTGTSGTKPADNYSTSTYSSNYSTPTYTTSTYSTPTYSSSSYSTDNYSAPTYSTKTVFTGSRGGQYYINSSGNKTYISK